MNKLGFSGILMLAAIAVLAMSVALVGIPAIAQWSGVKEIYVTYIFAVVFFFLAIYASRMVRKLMAVTKRP
ncbi:MAG: hypothetical protein JO254_05305 [Pseudolabrys sp.]|nr:hypothetical protein [Pseudolabrys sp.]